MTNWSSRRNGGEVWGRENISGDTGCKFFRTEQYSLWTQNAQQIPSMISRKEYTPEYIIFSAPNTSSDLKSSQRFKKKKKRLSSNW